MNAWERGFIISFHDYIWVVWLWFSLLWRGRKSSPCSVHGSGSLNIPELIQKACRSPEKTPAFNLHWKPPKSLSRDQWKKCRSTGSSIENWDLGQRSKTWNLLLTDRNMPTIFRVDLLTLNNLIKKINFKWDPHLISWLADLTCSQVEIKVNHYSGFLGIEYNTPLSTPCPCSYILNVLFKNCWYYFESRHVLFKWTTIMNTRHRKKENKKHVKD